MQLEQSEILTFEFVVDSNFNPLNVRQENLLPDNACFVLYNLFTQEECNQLIQQGENHGFLSLSKVYSSNYRNNERIINYNPVLRDTLWERITPYLDDTLEIHGKHPTLHTNHHTSGVWRKKELNDNFRSCKYFPQHFFKPHCDEGYHPDREKIRTMKTCMLYLNDDFTGGETIFYFDEDEDKPLSLKPEPGMCLIFNQKILHEGATVLSGLKYFVRTDIIYEKIQSDEVGELTERQREALKIYEEGVQEEKNNNHKRSIELYSKATKIYDNVYQLYNDMYT
eukprot:gene8782-9511_t